MNPRVANICVLAQNSAEITADFVAGIPEYVMSQLEGIVVTTVFFEF